MLQAMTELEVVQAWHDALNRGDGDALAALCTDDVAVAGPRGAEQGVAVMRDWVQRAGIHLVPRRWFQRGETVVVVQMAQWRAPDGGMSTPQLVVSVFTVRGGRIARVARHGDLAAALQAAGLQESDERR